LNMAVLLFGGIGALAALGSFALALRAYIARQKDRELKAMQKAQRKLRRDGYERRNREIQPVIDRVLGWLDGIYGEMDNPAEIARRLGLAIKDLRAAREGEPDNDEDS